MHYLSVRCWNWGTFTMLSKVFNKILIGTFLLVSLGSTVAIAQVKVGVLAPRGALKAMGKWTELGKYLGGKIGQEVKIIPVSVSKGIDKAAKGDFDFFLSNPVQTLILKKSNGWQPIASMEKNSGQKFAGVIISKKGSGITKSADLKGKKVMSLKINKAAGAYIFQAYHLQQNGIDVGSDLGSLKEGRKQDDLVFAVKAGAIDAAFVRSGLLENMAKSGKIKIDDFEIVDQRTDDGFNLVHTTILYPEWFLSASGNTDAKLVASITAAALSLTKDSKAATKARIKKFVAPLPLGDLETALSSLGVPPFGN